MADKKTVSNKTTIETEADKVSIVTEIKAGGVTSKTYSRLGNDGTVSVKETVEAKLLNKGLIVGTSAQTGSNALTGVTSSSAEDFVSLQKEFTLGGKQFKAKASINIVEDVTSKPAALDKSIAIVKTDLYSGLKLELKISAAGANEYKAEGNAFSFGGTNSSLDKGESTTILSSSTGSASVTGIPLNKNFLELSSQEYANAQTRLGNMIDSVKLNQGYMAPNSAAYQAASAQIAQYVQSKTNLKTAEVFSVAEGAEKSIRAGDGVWSKTTADNGQRVLWQKTDGTKLFTDSGTERVILIRADGSGDAFSYTLANTQPAQSFKLTSGATTAISVLADGIVRVSDGQKELLAQGIGTLVLSDKISNTTTYWQLNENGQYERRTLTGTLSSAAALGPDAYLGEIIIIGKRGDSINEATTPRNSASYITDDSANDHAVVIKTGGTVWDVYALQKNDSTGFKSWDEFKEAIAASNPNIADLNKIPVGTTIYLPEKFKDGSITYNYANGVSINSNAVNGEYHMVVPDGAGGTIVYSRSFYSRSADEFGYTVREVHTDKTGGVTLDYTGTQATLDAEIKPLGFEWNNSQETGKVQVFANSSSITSVEDKVTGDITETVKDSQQNVVESKTYDNHAARVEAAQQNALLAGVELFDAIRHKNNLGAISAVTRLVNESRIAADQPIVFAPQVGAVLGLIGALDSFGDAKTDAQKFVATARLVLSANTTYAAFNEGKGFLDAGAGFTALNVAGGVLALSSLDSTLKSGNPFAIASSVMALTNAAVATGLVTSATAAGALGTTAFSSAAVFGPQAMIAVAIASIVFGSLFGGSIEYPSPPPAGTLEIGALADGTLGMLLKDADGKVYQTRKLTGAVVSDSGKAIDNQDWGMGANVLSQRMVSLMAELQAQANKDGTHLVLDRLPTLSVHGFPSFERNGVDNFFFAMRFNDPGTGAQQLMAAANQDVAKQFKEIAGYAGAVVGNTEWAQIQAKKAAGMSLEDVQGDTTKGVTGLDLGNYSLRQTIPCIRYQWMRLRKSSPTATVGSFYQHGRTHPTIPRQPEQQAALPGYRAELPQSEADIRAFDAAVRQLIAPTVQLLMDDIQGVKGAK